MRLEKKSVKPRMNVNERKSLERPLKETSGTWRGGDGLKYQRRIRAELEHTRLG